MNCKQQAGLRKKDVDKVGLNVQRGMVMLVALTLWAAPEAAPSVSADPLPLDTRDIRTVLTMSPLDPTDTLDPTNRYSGQQAAIAFGKRLFFEKRLSSSGEISCATCHQPERGWADGRSLESPTASVGRHTPSLWNVGFNRWFNWDGRVDSLWGQALGPIEAPKEMANDRVNVVRLVIQDEVLRRTYEGVFGAIPEGLDLATLPSAAIPGPRNSDNPLHLAWTRLSAARQTAINRVFSNLGKAIAAFEATIISSDSAFDRFVEGLREQDKTRLAELSDSAKRGLKLFVGEAQCVACHSGPTFSDLEFHNVFLPSTREAADGDRGRYNGIPKVKKFSFNSKSPFNDAAPGEYIEWVTYVRRTVENRRQFKTPTLRNVERTAPYMHTGEFETLTETVEHCGSMEELIEEGEHSEVIPSSAELTDADIANLVAFLEGLTDESFLDAFQRP